MSAMHIPHPKTAKTFPTAEKSRLLYSVGFTKPGTVKYRMKNRSKKICSIEP